MGGLFKSKTEVTQAKNPYETNPWEPQIPFLTHGFEQGKEALSGALSGLNGITDLTADLTPGQQQDLKATTALGRGIAGTGQDLMGDISRFLGQGPQTAALPGVNRFMGNANDIMTGAGGGPVANTARTGLNMAKGVANFDPNVSPTSHSEGIYRDVRDSKFDDVTGQAQAYSGNPHLQGQIDSVLGDVSKAFQTDRGRLNAAASGVGGINSTRAGVMEAKLADEAMDRAAAISSDMRSRAYSEGLGVAQNMEQLRQGNMLNANSAIQGDDALRLNEAGMKLDAKTAGLSGVLNAGGLQLDNRSQADATKLGANAQVGQGAEMKNAFANDAVSRYGAGVGMLGDAYGLAQGGIQDSLGAGTVQQQQAQDEIAGVLQKLGLPMDFVQQYMQTVGGNHGSQGFQTQSQMQQKQSPAQTILGIASTAASLFCWVAREVYGTDNFKWVLFRYWVLNEAPVWFRNIYAKHGEAFAAYISNKPLLKRAVRRVFDVILKRTFP